MTTFLPGQRHPPIWDGAPLVVYKWSPKQHDKDMANPNQVLCFISCQGLCTQFEWLTPEFQFTATNFMSMAAKLSDLGNRMSEANLQREGHMDVPSQSIKDLWELETLGSSPSHSPSWSPGQRLPSGHPNTRHCLEIQVTLMEELGAVPPPSHSWMAPLVEDMLCDVRTSLTKVVVTGPGKAVLLYGRHSLGEGLTTDKARDATFLLTRVGMWVGKPAYLSANPTTIQGQWAIAQAIMDCHVNARGAGHPCVNLPVQQAFRFDHPRCSPIKDTSVDGGSKCQSLPHQPLRGRDCNRCQRDQRLPLPWFPSPSLDLGLESDRISLLMASSMSSRSDRWDGSWYSWWGRWHQEDAHLKINLPVFKDKDAVTYQSWRWDLTMYWHVGCRDHTLLLYAIQSLQSYPGKLVRSSGTDITLDDVLTILDEH